VRSLSATATNGAKDRINMLPESLKAPLRDHLEKVKANHDEDLAAGWGRVQMPAALDRKYPDASADWRWQWVFRRRTGGSIARRGSRAAITLTNYWSTEP
jgi:hypothetical protein